MTATVGETAGPTPTTATEPELRPVKNDEVVAHARKGCALCKHSVLGPGLLRITNKDRNGAGSVRHEVCSCAFKRFHKANPGLLYEQRTGQWYWPPEGK